MDMETRLLRLPGAGGESTLGILERRPHAGAADLPPLLLLHGATFGSAFLDLPRRGYSLMAQLAEAGRAVYALDVRGYGNSHNCAEMRQSPERGPPFADAAEVQPDIAAAVDFILERDRVTTLHLLGFSWGTIAAARYATDRPQTIGRLVLYAPLYGEKNPAWLKRIADPTDPSRLDPKFGAYRFVAFDEVLRRWNLDLPPGDPSQFREDGLPEIVFETLAATDPLSPTRVPRAFRCPNGALADLVRVFNGEPLYDPAKLTMPVLLVRGADDTTSTDADARQLLSRLASCDKNYRAIAPGSHFLCIEKNRSRLYQEINGFLA